MNTDNNSQSALSRLPEDAKEAAKEVAIFAKDTAEHVTDKAKEICHVASLKMKACETLEASTQFVRRNPVTVVLGAISIGAVIGYMVMSARRKPGFGERYAEEPLNAVREAILGAISPVTKRVHNGYESARDGAGKAMDRLHHFGSGCNGNSLSKRVERIGSNLKFW